MALTWNVKDVVDREGEDYVWGEKTLRPRTEAMIWATMCVDIGYITQGNWKKFAIRIRAWETVNQPIQGGGHGPMITPEDVRRHIGLRTNVIDTSDTKFKSKLAASVLDQADIRVTHEIAEGTKA